jgi:hypothetical protein
LRKRLLVGLVVGVVLAAAPSWSLQRMSRRVPFDSREAWTSTSSCAIQYYNNCTGWLWIWGGWRANERLGVTNASCCEGRLAQTQTLIYSGSPGGGWGFTGTLAVYAADANLCPTGAPLQSQPWLPLGRFSFQTQDWSVNVPSSRFCLLYTFGPAAGTPVELVTDHPAAGPTGPEACGTCYPTTRETHTFTYGTTDSPLCPGSPLADPLCNAELVVNELMSCVTPVQAQGWGSIKALYR